MKYSIFATLLTAAQLLPSAALKLAPRDSPRVLSLDIERRHVANPIAHDQLRRRQKTVQQTLDNLETLYFANASLGTPEQKFRFHIDTGSSDLWTNAFNSSLCKQDKGAECEVSGTYDPTASSTYEYVNSGFNISYVDGSGASGDYVKDTLHFGGKTIDGLQFGVGYQSSSSEGVLGIGYTITEVQVNRNGGKPYPNLPQLLANNGDIASNAYSLWLNDLDASTGNILFGGVDTEKFHGTLQTLPIVPEPNGQYAEFIVNMTGLGWNGTEGSIVSDTSIPVLLDSGSSLIYLPDKIVRTLYSTFNAQYDSSQGTAYVDCGLADQDGSLEFTFSGVNISVPFNELVLVAGVRRGLPICILGIAPAGDSTCVLGDTFLRSAYVVFDLDNNEISLAPTNFNASKSHIEEIQAGTDGVPSAQGANPVSTSAPQSTAAAMPMATHNAWLGAGAVVAGAGLLIGFDGLC